ncbi:hypothetical protein BJY01DRAFT_243701 [Aspergillus pseudoustus]|uniref:Uncharacterized protein n=1 Tax=Aspergillus pseudoustus TaxID=1810923 RepID=A0ABR4KQ16_9EURO
MKASTIFGVLAALCLENTVAQITITIPTIVFPTALPTGIPTALPSISTGLATIVIPTDLPTSLSIPTWLTACIPTTFAIAPTGSVSDNTEAVPE